MEDPDDFRDLKAVEFLLDHGADVNAKNIYHMRPIDYAIELGHTSLIRLLLENGASVEHRAHHPDLRSLLNQTPSPEYLAQFLAHNLKTSLAEDKQCYVMLLEARTPFTTRSSKK